MKFKLLAAALASSFGSRRNKYQSRFPAKRIFFSVAPLAPIGALFHTVITAGNLFSRRRRRIDAIIC